MILFIGGPEIIIILLFIVIFFVALPYADLSIPKHVLSNL